MKHRVKTQRITIVLILCCLAVFVSVLFFQPESVKAVEKYKAITVVAVQKGKTYRLKDILDLEATASFEAKNLRRKIRKGKKVSISGRELKVKNKKLYIFPIEVVKKTFQLRADEVSRIVIKSFAAFPPPEIEITDRAVIDRYVEWMNQIKYTFHFLETLRQRVGDTGNYIELYADDGSLIGNFKIGENGITDHGFRKYDGHGKYADLVSWKSESPLAGEFYRYVKGLFQTS